MNVKQKYLIILLVLLVTTVKGQNKSPLVYLKGVVVDEVSGDPILNATIYIPQANKGVTSNKDGEFIIQLYSWSKITISARHVGYHGEISKVDLENSVNKSDTIQYNISLKPKSYLLYPANVSAKQKITPDIVVGHREYSVSDFEFLESHIILLTYNKRLEKESVLRLTDNSGKQLSSLLIPCESQELYRDYLGNIYLLCSGKVMRVELRGTTLYLNNIDTEDFDRRITPCIDTLADQICFTNYHPDYPQFEYYSYNVSDSSSKMLTQVRDEELYGKYRYEFVFMSFEDQVYAMRMEDETGVDMHDIAAQMTGFTKSIYYRPLYAPLFIINDTIYIFDHYKNNIFKFNSRSKRVGDVAINYHNENKKSGWKKKLIKDEVTGKIYALFAQKGYCFLSNINPETGKQIDKFKLYFKYPENIKVSKGKAYYIYRPIDSIQKKYLYSEDISID